MFLQSLPRWKLGNTCREIRTDFVGLLCYRALLWLSCQNASQPSCFQSLCSAKNNWLLWWSLHIYWYQILSSTASLSMKADEHISRNTHCLKRTDCRDLMCSLQPKLIEGIIGYNWGRCKTSSYNNVQIYTYSALVHLVHFPLQTSRVASPFMQGVLTPRREPTSLIAQQAEGSQG